MRWFLGTPICDGPRSLLARFSNKTSLGQPSQEFRDIGLEAALWKLARQRSDQLLHRPSITELNDGGARFIENEHPFGKHELMLLAEHIVAIADVTRQHGPEDGGVGARGVIVRDRRHSFRECSVFRVQFSVALMLRACHADRGLMPAG
jgi:hypothetical protein